MNKLKYLAAAAMAFGLGSAWAQEAASEPVITYSWSIEDNSTFIKAPKVGSSTAITKDSPTVTKCTYSDGVKVGDCETATADEFEVENVVWTRYSPSMNRWLAYSADKFVAGRYRVESIFLSKLDGCGSPSSRGEATKCGEKRTIDSWTLGGLELTSSNVLRQKSVSSGTMFSLKYLSYANGVSADIPV